MASGINGFGFKPSTALRGPMMELDIETDGSPSAPKSGPFNPQSGDLNRIPLRCLDDASVGVPDRTVTERSMKGSFSADSRRVKKIDEAADQLADRIEATLRARKSISNSEKGELSVSFRQSQGDEGRTWVSSLVPATITEDDCKMNGSVTGEARIQTEARKTEQFGGKVIEAIRSMNGFRHLLAQLNSSHMSQVIPKNPKLEITRCTFHKPNKDFRKPSFEIVFINHKAAEQFISRYNQKPLQVYPVGTLGLTVGVHVNLGGTDLKKEENYLRTRLTEILGKDLSKDKGSEIGLDKLLGGLGTKFDDQELPKVGDTIAVPLRALQEPLEGMYVPEMKLSDLCKLPPPLLQELSDRVNPSDSPWGISDLPKIERNFDAEAKRRLQWELNDIFTVQEEQFKNLKV